MVEMSFWPAQQKGNSVLPIQGRIAQLPQCCTITSTESVLHSRKRLWYGAINYSSLISRSSCECQRLQTDKISQTQRVSKGSLSLTHTHTHLLESVCVRLLYVLQTLAEQWPRLGKARFSLFKLCLPSLPLSYPLQVHLLLDFIH